MIVFLLKACLISSPQQCEMFPFVTNEPSVEQCLHEAPKHLPEMVGNLALLRPDLKFAAFGCADITPGRDT